MNTCSNLLVVDDDPAVRALLLEYLGEHGFAVRAVGDGVAMRAEIERELPDLVLLDLRLPGEDGLTLARQLREQVDVGIVMVTGAGGVVDRVVGLEVGADDYIAKPFEPRELIARIKTVLRRAGANGESPVGSATEQLIFGGFTLDIDLRSLADAQNQPMALTGAEFDLLRCLAEAPGRPLTRDHILDITRSRDWSPLDRSIDVLIGRLRKKLEPDPDSPAIIKTVRGIGYVMSVPVRRIQAHKN